MTAATRPTEEQITSWSADDDVVALCLSQTLMPVEGHGAVFFPPTFALNAKIPYNIDRLSDGTRVVLVDSVGSQANRMEPMFAQPPYRSLIPQVTIEYEQPDTDVLGELSLLEAGHRVGDAVVRCTELYDETRPAIARLGSHGDASALARLAPTSLVFGFWDSRDTQVKHPRLLKSEIRAWDIDPVTRSAQFNPALDYAALDVFSEKEREKAEGSSTSPLATRGYVHQPATESHGGVVANGPIRRRTTLNFIALRRLHAVDDQGEVQASDTKTLRQYLLGLSLVAATLPMDGFLRQGCILVPDPDQPAQWALVRRDGSRTSLALTHAEALAFAEKAASAFGVSGESRRFRFDKSLAKKDATKKK